MNDKLDFSKLDFGLGFLLLLIGLLIGIAAGIGLTAADYKKRAVAAGVAEYSFDPETGAVIWKWKKP